MTDDLQAVADALEFYSDIGSYMAETFENKPGFDYKNTPVHLDGGNLARKALTRVRRLIADRPGVEGLSDYNKELHKITMWHCADLMTMEQVRNLEIDIIPMLRSDAKGGYEVDLSDIQSCKESLARTYTLEATHEELGLWLSENIGPVSEALGLVCKHGKQGLVKPEAMPAFSPFELTEELKAEMFEKHIGSVKTDAKGEAVAWQLYNKTGKYWGEPILISKEAAQGHRAAGRIIRPLYAHD